MAENRSRRGRSGLLGGGWTILRVRGVPVRVDLSWVLIAGLAVWSFANNLRAVLDGRGAIVLIASAGVAALLFFASILAHELGHAITSLNRGIRVLGISLFLLGGVTESASEAKRARDEFVIVGIGPFISLVLAAAFGLLATAVAPRQPYGAVFGALGWLNLVLAAFNVLPGYPLDGGRLLRSVLWAVSGRPHASTRWAARVGQAFALLLIAGGLYGLIGLPLPAVGLFGLALLFIAGNGLWSILIGFFLLRGATEAHARAGVTEQLEGRIAGEAMGSLPPVLDPEMSVADAIARLQERPSLLWPVGSPLRGAVRLSDLDAVAHEDWPVTPVGRVALDPAAVTVGADEPMDEVLRRLAEAPGNMLIVTEHDRPVGLLTPSLVAGFTS